MIPQEGGAPPKVLDTPIPKASDIAAYRDEIEGIEFEYPAALAPDGLIRFEDKPCLEFLGPREGISLEIFLQASYSDPFEGQQEKVTFRNDAIHEMIWRSYVTPRDVISCTFHAQQRVCIEARVYPPADAPLSEAIQYAVREIEETFRFRPSDRLDAKIAAAKVGQRFGPLTISRVVTREMEDKMKMSYAEGYGELSFSGAITLAGTMDDIGTGLSGPHPIFDADFQNPGNWPVDIGRESMGCMDFNNGSFVKKQAQNSSLFDVDSDVKMKLKNITVRFFASRGGCNVTADMIAISAAQSENTTHR
jgi:hypothetical protein